MFKRVLAAVLWFSTGWYLGAFAAFWWGLTPLLAPGVGVAALVLVIRDPWGMLQPDRSDQTSRK